MDQAINTLIEKHYNDQERSNILNFQAMFNYHNNVQGQSSMVCTKFDFEINFIQHDKGQYELWKSNVFANKFASLSTSPRNDSIIVEILWEMLCLYVIADETTVYYYVNNKWIADGGEYLWNLISTSFKDFVQGNMMDGSEALEYIAKVNTRKNIYMDIKKRLYYPNVKSKFNSVKGIIGVDNGTLELTSGNVRETRHTDFLTLSTKNIYKPLQDQNDLAILYNILKQVFPREGMLEFFIRSCSTFLEGYNSKKIFYVWWGYGNNCKTGMQTLVQSALGQYSGIAPVSLITSKRSGSSNATPELVHLKDKLIVFIQEPNQREELKTGRIKELSGNDKIYTRGLFQKDAIEMDVKCKLVLVVNVPNVGQNTDSAFKKRVVVVPFESTFLPYNDYAMKYAKNILQPNTYLVDERYEQLFTILGPVFLWVLVQEYNKFLEDGMKIPYFILQKTEEFLTYNNYCLKYIRNNLRVVDSTTQTTGVDSNVIYELFKYWMRDRFPGKSIPASDIFTKELIDEGFVEDEDGNIHGVSILNYETKTVF